MKFVCCGDMRQLPGDADALFAHAEKDSLFSSRPWYENLAEAATQEGQTLLFACVTDGDQVLAILPLMQASGTVWQSLRHRYGSFYSLLLTDQNQQQILACLAQGLSTSRIESLLLEPIDEHDDSVNGLQASLEACGYSCQRSFRFYNWVLAVQGRSFAEYMADRPTKLRNTIARKQRKLEREQDYEIRLFTGDEAPQWMPDYYAVYGASWKANEQYAAFLNGMVAGFSKPGWSRLAILYIEGKPAAAQLWFVLHNKASIFRLSYDEAWKHYSPGSILTRHLMEYVIDTDQVREVDFLTGNEVYKQDWMSDRRQRWALSCVKDAKPTGYFTALVDALKGMLGART